MSQRQAAESNRSGWLDDAPGLDWQMRVRPSLAGRERERELLRGWLARAVDGRGRFVLVSGEAGIGKTTLVEDLSASASEQGVLVLSGGAYDISTTPPYGPWVEIIGAYPDDERLPAVPDQLRAGRGMAGIDSQVALFELASRFLSGVAAVRPVLLVLEDLHWADPASLDLLRYLARTLSGQPVQLIATYRDDEIIHDHPLSALLPVLVREGRAQRLNLRRLDHEAVLAIVRQRYRLSSGDESRLLGYLDSLAEGNPFFVHELLYTLEGQELLRPIAGGWKLGDLAEAGAPTLIQQVIDARLARLDRGARTLLDLAAVIGYDVSLDLLSELHEGSAGELDIALQQVIDHHLLQAGVGLRSVRFHHALVRQAIYEEISLLQRRELHRRAGDLLAARTRPDPATVANHLYQAGDERALDWSLRAAEQAQRLFAPEAVIAESDRAIDLAGQLNTDASPAFYRLRGLARESLGDFDGARADQETALEQARALDDRRAEWQALLDLGMLWASRDYQQTREYCERAVELARTMDDPVALGHSLNRLGNWHANAEQPANALRYHEEALRIFEELQDVRGVGNTLDLLGMANALYGDIPRSGYYFTRAIPLLRQIGDHQALHSALVNASIGSWGGWLWRIARFQESTSSHAEIEALQLEALEIAREIGWRSGVAYAMVSIGLRASVCGELRTAMEYLSSALAEAQDIRHQQWIAQANNSTGLTFVDLLIPDLARAHLQDAVDIAGSIGSSFFEVGSAGLLAAALIQQGNYGEAEHLLQRYVDLSEQPTMASVRHCWYACAELALAEKRVQDALDLIDRLIHSIPDGRGPISPYLTRLRGEILLAIGRLDEAEAQLAESHDDATRLGFPLIFWRILATQARLYLAQGRTDKAREAGNAASKIVINLARQLDDEDLRAEFLRNARALIPGMPPYAPDRAIASIYAGLTPRELEVLQAVADGLTDAEAGERLFISTRTVSQHLRSIYNKLGVNNRAAAVRVAMEHELI